MSTKHQESPGVLAALYQLSQNKLLKSRGQESKFRSSGSVQLWADVSRPIASIAIVYTAGTKIVFAVLQAHLQDVGANNHIPEGMTDLGNGFFVDLSKSIWAAAFILGKGLGKAYNPEEVFTLEEGLAAWEYKKKQYKYFTPLSEIQLP